MKKFVSKTFVRPDTPSFAASVLTPISFSRDRANQGRRTRKLRWHRHGKGFTGLWVRSISCFTITVTLVISTWAVWTDSCKSDKWPEIQRTRRDRKRRLDLPNRERTQVIGVKELKTQFCRCSIKKTWWRSLACPNEGSPTVCTGNTDVFPMSLCSGKSGQPGQARLVHCPNSVQLEWLFSGFEPSACFSVSREDSCRQLGNLLGICWFRTRLFSIKACFRSGSKIGCESLELSLSSSLQDLRSKVSTCLELILRPASGTAPCTDIVCSCHVGHCATTTAGWKPSQPNMKPTTTTLALCHPFIPLYNCPYCCLSAFSTPPSENNDDVDKDHEPMATSAAENNQKYIRCKTAQFFRQSQHLQGVDAFSTTTALTATPCPTALVANWRLNQLLRMSLHAKCTQNFTLHQNRQNLLSCAFCEPASFYMPLIVLMCFLSQCLSFCVITSTSQLFERTTYNNVWHLKWV